MRWLERYLTEGSPRLKHFAEIGEPRAATAGSLTMALATYLRIEERELEAGGLN